MIRSFRYGLIENEVDWSATSFEELISLRPRTRG